MYLWKKDEDFLKLEVDSTESQRQIHGNVKCLTPLTIRKLQKILEFWALHIFFRKIPALGSLCLNKFDNFQGKTGIFRNFSVVRRSIMFFLTKTLRFENTSGYSTAQNYS